MSRRLAALSVLCFSICLVGFAGLATGQEGKAKATAKSTAKGTKKGKTAPAPEKTDK